MTISPSQDYVRCPSCHSRDVRYSHRTTLDTIFAFLFHWKAFRCRNCRHRFRRKAAQPRHPLYIS